MIPSVPKTTAPAILSSVLPPAVAYPNIPNAPMRSGSRRTFDACIILPNMAPLPAATAASCNPLSDSLIPSTRAIPIGTDFNILIGAAYVARVIGVIAKPAKILPDNVSGASNPIYSGLLASACFRRYDSIPASLPSPFRNPKPGALPIKSFVASSPPGIFAIK